MKLKLFLILYLFPLLAYCQHNFKADSLKIEELNSYANRIRSENPEKTIYTGKKALRLAEKINYELGRAEAYRVIGTGYAALDEPDTAMAKFLLAFALFEKHDYHIGEAKVYNNIGNLYRIYDHNKALNYYLKCLKIAQKYHYGELEAGSNLNIANIYIKKKNYSKGLACLNHSYNYFAKAKDTVSLIYTSLSKVLLFRGLQRFEDAEAILLKTKTLAEEKQMYPSLGSINLNLALIFKIQRRFDKAEAAIKEGIFIAKKLGDKKLERDFLVRKYELELAEKNYKGAFNYLKDLYSRDSIIFNELTSKKFTLHQEQFQFLKKEQERKVLEEKQKTNRVIIISTIIVIILSFIVIALLVMQSRKKAKTLKKMQELNEEISLQKDNLNKVNQNLETIIEERTQDLQVKNLKLSQYSSHLSHEIRSPISTIKGLLILDDEDLIDDQELISEVKRCVEEIDHKLLNINQMLHNPQYKAFVLPENKNGGTNSAPPEKN